MSSVSQRRYTTGLWLFLGYTVAVVLWGALVRATLSGDGCGAHWPLCNGEVLPVAPTRKTIIELTHRVTSGLCWFGALAFFLWSRRVFAPGHLARRAMGWALFFMTTEALIGAGLVLFRMVADNPAVARAYWMGAHLTNTFLLLMALTVGAWASSRETSPALNLRSRPAFHLGLAHLAVLAVGITGAIAALGDTLFPVSSVLEGLQRDLSPTAHLFERRRVWHPLVAFVTSLYLVSISVRTFNQRTGRLQQLAALLGVLAVVQVAAGFINVWLLAPVWMQLVHLLLADLTWIVLVLLGVSVASMPARA